MQSEFFRRFQRSPMSMFACEQFNHKSGGNFSCQHPDRCEGSRMAVPLTLLRAHNFSFIGRQFIFLGNRDIDKRRLVLCNISFSDASLLHKLPIDKIEIWIQNIWCCGPYHGRSSNLLNKCLQRRNSAERWIRHGEGEEDDGKLLEFLIVSSSSRRLIWNAVKC